MTEEKQLIERYEYTGQGYNPYLIVPHWQIAQLNYEEATGFYNLFKMDIHHHTDEVFILKKGLAVLIAACFQKEEIVFEPLIIQPGVVYNIPVNCWHNIMLEKDAEVFIVENAHTHEWDFEFYQLTAEEKEKMDKSVRYLLEGTNSVKS